MRIAVLGHVEHVEFAHVDGVPAAGQIAHASAGIGVAAGGGAVAAVQIARLTRGCDFFTVLGDDDLGRACAAELEALGVRVHAVFEGTQRRALTLVEPSGERTIITIGPKLAPRGAHDLPWELLDGAAGAFFVAGDGAALAAARSARVLTATTRELGTLAGAGVFLDALVGSGRDPGESYPQEGIDPPPGAVLVTAGADGGRYRAAGGAEGEWSAAAVPGALVDTYGCGDSFAAALTVALARGDELAEAVAFGALCGAACAAGQGPYQAQLAL